LGSLEKAFKTKNPLSSKKRLINVPRATLLSAVRNRADCGVSHSRQNDCADPLPSENLVTGTDGSRKYSGPVCPAVFAIKEVL
jgi:hypothetical protein